jgi:integrase
LRRTNPAQNLPASARRTTEERNLRFPKVIQNKKTKARATIYGKKKAYPFYRVCWRVNGKRQMRTCSTYSEAKRAAEELVKDLGQGSQLAALSAAQANQALLAFGRLQSFYQATGQRVGLADAVGQFCDAATKLGDRPLAEAVASYLTVTAVVKRKALSEAVAEFLDGRKHLTAAKDGERSRRSPVYEYHVQFWLNEFAETFPGHAVCDLTKDHLDTYISQFKELSPKSRNDRRMTVKMFLRWATAKDYLPQNHRLFEAVGFKAEDTDIQEKIEFYSPKELTALLGAADSELLPVIALSGLAGLRIGERLRLSWQDVWKVESKIEIGARIAKGRNRRLVTMGPALADWLVAYRHCTGRVCDKNPMQFNRAFVKLRASLGIPPMRNGLRRGYISHHYALHNDENLVASEAGNSPQMVHDYYRGLTTADMAQQWFDTRPKQQSAVGVPLVALKEV